MNNMLYQTEQYLPLKILCLTESLGGCWKHFLIILSGEL